MARKLTDNQSKDSICVELKEISNDNDIYAHMSRILKICGCIPSTNEVELYKAILIKTVLDCLGRSNYSDYLLAIFGLLKGYDDETMSLTEKRGKYLLEKNFAYDEDTYSLKNPPNRTEANNYRRTIKEDLNIERLAKYFLYEIRDWGKHISGAREYLAIVRGGTKKHNIATLPTPYYELRKQFLPDKVLLPEQNLAAIASAIIKTLFVDGDAFDLEIQEFKIAPFEVAIRYLFENRAMTRKEYYSCMNFLKTVNEAAEELHGGDESLAAKNLTIDTDDFFTDSRHNTYDFDWFLRFYDSVSNIGNEDMQKLWGKILAGEMRHKGACSLRTMSALFNMRSGEARSLKNTFFRTTAIPVLFSDDDNMTDIEEPFPFITISATIRIQDKNDGNMHGFLTAGNSDYGESVHETYELGKFLKSNGPISRVQDCNIVGYAEEESTVCLNNENLGFIFGNIIMIVKCSRPAENKTYIFNYKVLPFREAGRELYKIVKTEPNVHEVINIASKWKALLAESGESNIDISVHKLNHWSATEPAIVDYEPANILETESTL